MDLRLRLRDMGAATLLEIGGEIDLHSAPQLRAALLKAAEGVVPRLTIDLSEVIFIDSTGVGVLVGALKRARAAGGEITFCSATTRVRRVFEITGLSRVLPLFPSREAALDAQEKAQKESKAGTETSGTLGLPVIAVVGEESGHD